MHISLRQILLHNDRLTLEIQPITTILLIRMENNLKFA